MSVHGGDIYRNKVDIDFSVNISPYGVPPMVRAALNDALLDLSVYPDPAYETLRGAIAKAEGVQPDDIVCGNGASELLQASLQALYKMLEQNCKPWQENRKQPELSVQDMSPQQRNLIASIFTPGFLGYEKAIKVAGFAQMKKVPLTEEKNFLPEEDDMDRLLEEAAVIVLGNPNNPTGKLLDKTWLCKLLQKAEQAGSFVVLDETFLPLTEQKKMYDDIHSAHCIRIRAFTKSMAIPGVRLGYLLCENRQLLAAIWQQLPEWNVSVIADRLGMACAQAGSWLDAQIQDEKQGLAILREELARGLTHFGIRVFDSDTNFLLLKSEINLYEKLLSYGILIRDCSNFDSRLEGYYRVAVKGAEENRYLLEVLKENVPKREKSGYVLSKVAPAEIERTSFAIISSELAAKGIFLEGDTAPVIKRCIHTTADFQYATSLVFSEDAISRLKTLIRKGAWIVTDTNMAMAGINKTELAKYGGECHCFMADPDIARMAKEQASTRAAASMEHAATLQRNIIFVIGNAPTALVRLCEMMDQGTFVPDFVIGVPVGFVNVEPAKEMMMEKVADYIVNRGRKGGSNVAAAIVNAVLYAMRDE